MCFLVAMVLALWTDAEFKQNCRHLIVPGATRHICDDKNDDKINFFHKF